MEKRLYGNSLNKAIERATDSKFITEDATNAIMAINEFPELDMEIDDNVNQLMDVDLEDLLDDDVNQITASSVLFNAFENSSKNKKYYDKNTIRDLYKYVVYLYNDTIEVSEKYGALTYLQKISKSLDFLEVSNIMELSLDQLFLILRCRGKKIKDTYEIIKERRHYLTDSDFEIYRDMLKNTRKFSSKEAKTVYAFIKDIYNNNPIIQDNVQYKQFLKKFASLNQSKVVSMRMHDILKLLNIRRINYENVNESRNLLNDCSDMVCTQ